MSKFWPVSYWKADPRWILRFRKIFFQFLFTLDKFNDCSLYFELLMNGQRLLEVESAWAHSFVFVDSILKVFFGERQARRVWFHWAGERSSASISVPFFPKTHTIIATGGWKKWWNDSWSFLKEIASHFLWWVSRLLRFSGLSGFIHFYFPSCAELRWVSQDFWLSRILPEDFRKFRDVILS